MLQSDISCLDPVQQSTSQEMYEHTFYHCPLIRELWEHFSKHAVDKQCMRLLKIRPALHEIGLYPSKSQGKFPKQIFPVDV